MNNQNFQLEKDNKVLFGVCSGIAKYKNKSVAIIRLKYFVGIFIYGISIYIYFFRYLQARGIIKPFKSYLNYFKQIKNNTDINQETKKNKSNSVLDTPKRKVEKKKGKSYCDICDTQVGGLFGSINVASYIPKESLGDKQNICKNCAKNIEITCETCQEKWNVNYDESVLTCPACYKKEQEEIRKKDISKKIASFREKSLSIVYDDFEDIYELEVNDFYTWNYSTEEEGAKTWNASLAGIKEKLSIESYFIFNEEVMGGIRGSGLKREEDLVIRKSNGDVLTTLRLLSLDRSVNPGIMETDLVFYLSMKNIDDIMDCNDALSFTLGVNSFPIQKLDFFKIVIQMWKNEFECCEENIKEIYNRNWIKTNDNESSKPNLYQTILSANEESSILSWLYFGYFVIDHSTNEETLFIKIESNEPDISLEISNTNEVLVKVGDFLKRFKAVECHFDGKNLSFSAFITSDVIDTIKLNYGKEELKIRMSSPSGDKYDWIFEINNRMIEKIEIIEESLIKL